MIILPGIVQSRTLTQLPASYRAVVTTQFFSLHHLESDKCFSNVSKAQFLARDIRVRFVVIAIVTCSLLIFVLIRNCNKATFIVVLLQLWNYNLCGGQMLNLRIVYACHSVFNYYFKYLFVISDFT